MHYTRDAREREWDMGQGFAQRIWKGIGEQQTLERKTSTDLNDSCEGNLVKTFQRKNICVVCSQWGGKMNIKPQQL